MPTGGQPGLRELHRRAEPVGDAHQQQRRPGAHPTPAPARIQASERGDPYRRI